MADKKNPDNPNQPLQEEDIIARLKSAGGGDLAGVTTYTGLLGRSSREGYWLLYPTLDMSTSIEIQESDIVHSEPLSPEQSPFGGLGGTLAFVRKGAQVTTTRTLSRTAQTGTGDEFDLDLRVGPSASGFPGQADKSGYVCSVPCSENPRYCRDLRLGNKTDACATGGVCSVGAQCESLYPILCTRTRLGNQTDVCITAHATCGCTRNCPPHTIRPTCVATRCEDCWP